MRVSRSTARRRQFTWCSSSIEHLRSVFILIAVSTVLVGCSGSAEPTPQATAIAVQVTVTDPLPTPLPPPTATAASEATEAPPPTSEIKRLITVGSSETTEQRLIGQLMVALLRANGYDVVDSTGMGDDAVVRAALENGDIDIALGLTGLTLMEFVAGGSELTTDPRLNYELVRSIDGAQGLVWLESADYNSTPVVLVRQSLSEQGVRSLDDLARYSAENEAKLCVPNSLSISQLQGLITTYGLQFQDDEIEATSEDNALNLLRTDGCQIAVGQISDGRIDAWNLSIVIDNRSFFPINNPAPVVRAEILEQSPEVGQLLNGLFANLSGRVMQTLSAQILVGADGNAANGDERSMDEVVTQYLERTDLLGELPSIRVGITEDQAQGILGLLAAFTLIESGFSVEERTYADDSVLRDALMRGDVDVAWGNTADVLMTVHKIPFDTLPADVDAMFSLVESLDKERFDLQWLTPAPLNPASQLFAATDAYTTVEDVAAALDEGTTLRICVDPQGAEFLFKAWSELFEASFDANAIVTKRDEQEIFAGIGNAECELALANATSPETLTLGLTPLADTVGLIPISSVAPVVRQEVLQQHDELAETVATLSGLIETSVFAEMRKQVVFGADATANTNDESTVAEAAQSFLAVTRLVRNRPNIAIGAQNFTETLLLAEMTELLFVKAGFTNVDQVPIGGSVNDQYAALDDNTIDVTWVYVGAALQAIHGQVESIGNSLEAWQAVSEFDADKPYRWLAPTSFNNTFALLIDPSRLEVADQINSIADLAGFMNANAAPLSICVDEDFFKRPDGLLALQFLYDFEFNEQLIRIVPFSDLYASLAAGECDVAEGFRTDARIESGGFRVLDDTRNFFPAYNAAPLLQEQYASAYPNLVNDLERLAAGLTDEVIAELNALIDFGPDGLPGTRDEEAIEIIAELYLCDQGFIDDNCPVSDDRVKTIVAAQGESANCQTVDLNGGFEQLRLWEIPNTRVPAQYSEDEPHSGGSSMKLGLNQGSIEGHSIVQQTILLPSDVDSAEISFEYLVQSQDTTNDVVGLFIYDIGITEPKSLFDIDLPTKNGWQSATFDLTQHLGERVVLYFLVINDGDTLPTLAYVDDVDLQLCTMPEN